MTEPHLGTLPVSVHRWSMHISGMSDSIMSADMLCSADDMLAEIGVRTKRPGDDLAWGEGVLNRCIPGIRGDSDRLERFTQ